MTWLSMRNELRHDFMSQLLEVVRRYQVRNCLHILCHTESPVECVGRFILLSFFSKII